MLRIRSFLITIIALSLGSCTSSVDRADRPADLILTNGLVRTIDPERPLAEAVAVKGHKIVFVGSAEGAASFRGPATRVLDLDGGTVIPGLVDAHAHLMGLGKSLTEVDLLGTTSVSDVVERVRAWQADVSRDAWIHGRGWDQNDWSRKEFPSWEDLEEIANPVCLRRVDGHALWVSRSVLEHFGIDGNTPDPEGGRIIRDAPGNPTGVLIDNAMDLILDNLPAPSQDEQLRRIRLAVGECNRLGLTGLHDAGTTETHLGILRSLIKENALSLRVYAMLDTDDSLFVRSRIVRGRSSESDHLLTIRAIKLYADGALGSRGAALLAPYGDEPAQSGLFVRSKENLSRWTSLAIENGFQVCTHAIGDAGVRRILDVYAQALRRHPVEDHRLRIEHVQVTTAEDIDRMADLNIIASMQPTHATSDMYWAEDRVGPDRIRYAYAWRKIMNRGCVVACGSDFPVEAVSPLWGIYAAVTRQDHDGYPQGGWYPEERMTVLEAVKGFTINAAHAAFAEDLLGSVEPGKYADLTVLDKDIFTIPAPEILSTRVLYTIVGGGIAYSLSEESDRGVEGQ